MTVEYKSERTQENGVGTGGILTGDDTGDTKHISCGDQAGVCWGGGRGKERERETEEGAGWGRLLCSPLMLCCVSADKILLKLF